jgi:hypothetical protein
MCFRPRLALGSLVSALFICVSLAGCGDNGKPLVANVLTQTTDEVAPPAGGPGPYGKLGFAHLGPAKKGMSKDQVLSLFGSPTKIEPLAADPGSCQVSEEWTWDLPVGSEIPKKSIGIEFEPPNDTIAAYSVGGGHYKTDFGVGIGSTYKELRRAFGGRLKPLFPSEPNPLSRTYVKHGVNRLLFVLGDRKVDLIIGGHLRGCQ